KSSKEAAPTKEDPIKSEKKDEPKKEASPPKDEPKKEAPPPKDETVISGGSECKARTPILPLVEKPTKKKKETIETLLYNKADPTMKKKVPLTRIQGGAPDCQAKQSPEGHLARRYQKYSLCVALPLIAILTLIVFGNRLEEDRLEFKNYGYMYKREKRFSFGDGNRSAFHNSYYNALPPDGYEDEIDEEGLGQEPETEKDKKSRLKEFETVFKKWKKHDDKRDAQV
ncbi:hypothetical protein KR038_010845, partial [Drosophila bunnanda]